MQLVVETEPIEVLSSPEYFVDSARPASAEMRRRRIVFAALLVTTGIAGVINPWLGIACFIASATCVSAWGASAPIVIQRGVVEREVVPARVTRRYSSEACDLVLQLSPLAVAIAISGSPVSAGAVAALAYAVAYPVLCYRLINETVGKRLFGLTVIRKGGKPVGTGYVVRRELVVKRLLMLIFGPLTLWIGPLLDAYSPYRDSRRRAWHDRMMESYVVDSAQVAEDDSEEVPS